MADAKNARLDELRASPEPPLDPPPPYEELCSTYSRPINHHDDDVPPIANNRLSSSSIRLEPQAPSADPAGTLLSPKQAAAQHLASPSSLSSLSSHSIPPPPRSPSDPRRTLLLVYIHGFYGNNQSFGSFPAHVHHRLASSPALARSHVVHSKVYPRYKTYKAIDVARDNFSAWLAPHESPTTDVVLLGHSMGGLLAAEIVLKPSEILSPRPFKHRILGTVSLDAPFLGLHPGIVASGIASLFRPDTQTPPTHPAATADADFSTSTSTSTINLDANFEPEVVVLPGPADPNFDPPYFNDSPFRERSFLDRVVNFASKHSSEGILHALGNHFTDHLAFGGCLADYRGLLSRYNRLRALEDVDPRAAPRGPSSPTTRVRFVNYYTLCPGRPKPSKPSPSQIDLSSTPNADETVGAPAETEAGTGPPAEASSSSAASLRDLDPTPITEDDQSDHDVKGKQARELEDPGEDAPDPDLPPPIKPETPDFSQYADKEARKQAERDFSRLEKAYARDLKTHEKILRERQKLADKQRRQLDKAAEKEAKERRKKEDKDLKEERKLAEKHQKEQKQADKEFKEEHEQAEKELKEERKQAEKNQKKERKQVEKSLKEERKQAEKAIKEERRQAEKSLKEEHKEARQLEKQAAKNSRHLNDQERKQPKLRKFCTTPRAVDGAPDLAWVPVFMDGVDEVGAHCGLFVAGAHYDAFVMDVGDRIEDWVGHALLSSDRS